MKDLSDRFAQGEATPAGEARADPLARLQRPSPDDPDGNEKPLQRWRAGLRGRAELLTAICAALAAVLVLWPLLHPVTVQLPPIADTGDEVATLAVRPLSQNGVAAPPDWAGLFNAYQLETSLRDISIRCNYGLSSDARVDRYLHARLMAGTAIRVFLADPGTCPKL
jgi:hypothetical protein